MLGPGTKLKDMTEDEKGCMPRAMYQIFDALENSGKYSSWKMQLSYIEVYLEKIYDLLGTPGKAGLVEGDVIVSKDGVARLKNITPTSVGSLKVGIKTRLLVDGFYYAHNNRPSFLKIQLDAGRREAD